ncbi:MAG: hypothetical protein MJZ21_00245 [archaeon]|nr:hypothetical protein [archaeon]
MEIDDFIEKSEKSPESAEAYEALIDFLKNDIKGYKAIIDDLKDGSCDFSGNYYDIASLPEKAVGLYNDFYLPGLKDEDYQDEVTAMNIKSSYAVKLVEDKYVKIGRAAIENPKVRDIMCRNGDILALLGKIVLSEPELINAINEN